MIYNAIIVDDEPKIRKVMQIKLNQYCKDIHISGMATNVTEAFSLIQKDKPQIVFLDISMPGGSGFDLLDKFETLDFEVVFVTGFNDYALDALKISAVDYLLKPVITEDLIRAVEKAKDRINNKEKAQMYNLLKHNINNIGNQDTKFAVAVGGQYELIRVGDIIRCEGWQKYTRLHLKDRKPLISSHNLGNFKEMLESYGFYSTHKSHIINTKEIISYSKEGLVVMSDNSHVPVARRKKEDFMEEVLKHILMKN